MVPLSSSRGLSLKKNGSAKPHQVKMTHMPGMVRLGRREVSRSHSPTVTDEEDVRAETPLPPQTHIQVKHDLIILLWWVKGEKCTKQCIYVRQEVNFYNIHCPLFRERKNIIYSGPHAEGDELSLHHLAITGTSFVRNLSCFLINFQGWWMWGWMRKRWSRVLCHLMLCCSLKPLALSTN